MTNLTRRRFLRSMAAAGVMAPLSMTGLSSLALASSTRKLKIVFAVIPDGFGVDAYGGFDNGLWFPATSDLESTNFELNEMSQHLGTYANQSLFLRGILLSSGTGGHNAWQYVLRDSAGSKTSIDLLLGNHMPGTNPSIKRIYSGPHSMVGAQWNISYQDGNKILPEDNPYQLFEQLFGNYTGGGSGGEVDDRTHLFDPIASQISALRSELSVSQRAKLDTHLDAIEQVKIDLGNSVPVGDECNPGLAEPEAGMSIHSADYRDEVTRAHSNIIAAGLSCGTSRVATLQIGRSADPVVIKSVSTTRNPHDCAHRYGSVNEWKESRAWYVKQVRYLLERLEAHPDPDVAGENLLQNTLVVFTSEMADGAPEHMQDVPVTLIGGAAGLLNNGNGSGRLYNIQPHGDRSHWKMGTAVDMQRIWSTIAQAAGTNVPYAGDISAVPGIFTNV